MNPEFLLAALIVVLIPGTGVPYTIATAITRNYIYKQQRRCDFLGTGKKGAGGSTPVVDGFVIPSRYLNPDNGGYHVQ